MTTARVPVQTTIIPIRWGDMDAQGHVNNTVYFRYMEQARIEWLLRVAEQIGAGSGPGSVIVNALVNENGQVIDTRILTSASSILNEAALNSVRRSTFAPGTKDGVRVKSWTPVRVDFKL